MTEIKFDSRNYRIHTDKNKRVIRKSLEDCGAGRSVLVDKENVLIAGNGVYEQAQELGIPVKVIESDGKELIVVKRMDLSSKDEKRKMLALVDNHASDTSMFDMDLVIEDFTDEALDLWEFAISDADLYLPESTLDNEKAGSLKERFIIPPFSILDAKQGIWQERKKAWLSLGIKSEVGRDSGLTFKRSAQSPRIYEVRNKMRSSLGYDPSWDEIFEYCRNNDIPTMGGTSIFDPVLCELVYRWFNVPEGVVLDPFAGGSVRGIVAYKIGMAYRGVELRQEQVDANYSNFREIFGENTDGYIEPMWLCDDSANINTNEFSGLQADLLFSCPPYADLEVYSDDPRDLSNMEYKEFMPAYRIIIQKSCKLLNDNRFAVFVVGEVRSKDSSYYNFVSETIKAFLDAGLHYYNEMILVNQICSLAMRTTKQFNHSRKIGKHHQNVLVFYKGDLKEIPNIYPELDFTEDELFNKE